MLEVGGLETLNLELYLLNVPCDRDCRGNPFGLRLRSATLEKRISISLEKIGKYNSISPKDCNAKPGDVAVALVIARNEAIGTRKPQRQSPK